ncbi:MAG: hypothetical protein JWR44_3144 [Hymenobacter sp.]|nr:hypothetical protein [Hymenobacter sp.]
MISLKWKQLLPARPVVPARLWLTAGAAVVIMFSLAFSGEIWTNKQVADAWSWALLLVLLFWGGTQAVWILLRWPETYPGPLWMKLLIRGVAWFVGIGIAILLVLLFIAGWVLLVMLLTR